MPKQKTAKSEKRKEPTRFDDNDPIVAAIHRGLEPQNIRRVIERELARTEVQDPKAPLNP